MILSLKQKLKKLKIKLSGKYNFLKVAVKCKKKWFGKQNFGFFVCTDNIDENSIVYSFGIGEDISFDKELIEKLGCKVFGFDPTPKSIKWIKNQKLPQNFTFFEYGISTKTGFIDFFLPKNPDFVSGSSVNQQNINESEKIQVQMKTFRDICKELNHNKIDILKIDIEGSEYEVIEDILKSDIKISQILIEFHDRFIENGIEKTRKAVENLKNKGFEIFAVSDSFEEISFINLKLQNLKIK